MRNESFFESKIEFPFIRNYLTSYCVSSVGKDKISEMKFSTDREHILLLIRQTLEFVSIIQTDEFPSIQIHDIRQQLKHIRIPESYMLAHELHEVHQALLSIDRIVRFLSKTIENKNEHLYPNLHLLTCDISDFTNVNNSIGKILDDYGNIKDNASPDLAKIRRNKVLAARKVSKVLESILKQAQKDGYVESGVAPTVRDGRLVLPLSPANKKKINGIIHDESDSGKTVFIEPTQVVEANNEINELENEERKEIIRILKFISAELRPHIDDMLDGFKLLAEIDFVRAKAKFAILTNSCLPIVKSTPLLDWTLAIHPILKIHFDRKKDENQQVVPLDIKLSAPQQRILIISGPNAGGKSVCLKTVGLLQYMLQCGMPVPMSPDSQCGLFDDIFIDIGDEQSIENELSTFSSHLVNMKNMMKWSNERSLLLIDEFGGGTEPMIGGALAQAILKKLNSNKVFGVITTHFQNLKQYAQESDGIVNGAMLYDRQEMRPLFQLRIGNPGSSFAIEIARKIGIPQDVINEASDIVGNDYISSDKYLQDIIRDKRYWENKRQEIHLKEKRMEETINRYEAELTQLRSEKRIILDKAKEDAKQIIEGSNAMVEKTIKTIKEAEAEREQTLKAREELKSFKDDLEQMVDDRHEQYLQRQADKIKRRQERKKQKGRHHKDADLETAVVQASAPTQRILKVWNVGDYVKLKHQQTIGKILKVNSEKEYLVAFGNIQMNVQADQLEMSEKPKETNPVISFVSRDTRDNIRETTLHFKPEIDVRGMRGDEALQAITYFVDDAQVAQARRLRILHGTGSGILRSLIRQYLSTVSAVVSYRDEHPQFGGAGITVVELE